jgi:hypothetical protein
LALALKAAQGREANESLQEAIAKAFRNVHDVVVSHAGSLDEDEGSKWQAHPSLNAELALLLGRCQMSGVLWVPLEAGFGATAAFGHVTALRLRLGRERVPVTRADLPSGVTALAQSVFGAFQCDRSATGGLPLTWVRALTDAVWRFPESIAVGDAMSILSGFIPACDGWLKRPRDALLDGLRPSLSRLTSDRELRRAATYALNSWLPAGLNVMADRLDIYKSRVEPGWAHFNGRLWVRFGVKCLEACRASPSDRAALNQRAMEIYAGEEQRDYAMVVVQYFATILT